MRVGQVVEKRRAIKSGQRSPYAWQCEHAQVLLDDLLGFLGTGMEKIEDFNP
jgi:hypothetical protein